MNNPLPSPTHDPEASLRASTGQTAWRRLAVQIGLLLLDWAVSREIIQEQPDRSGLLAGGRLRSPKWETVRRAHLSIHPACAVTGETTGVEVHHVVPFHEAPELELDPRNLMTLSSSSTRLNGLDVHRWIGHLGDWRSINPRARQMAEAMRSAMELK